MDIGTGLALFGTAKVTEKLLGPTASYLGEGIKTLVEKRANNVRNIFSIAIKKLGNKIETKGAVPPKVLKGILDEGSYCEDFLAAEYLGGVLASSRSGVARDDRGASFIALISRLSSYQLRSHYVFYSILRKLFVGTRVDVGTDRSMLETYIPMRVFVEAMEFDYDERKKLDTLISHILSGLVREGLIDPLFAYGPREYLQKYVVTVPEEGVVFQPSMLGIELFLWAYGLPDLPIQEFTNQVHPIEIDRRVIIKEGYEKIVPLAAS